MNRFALTILDDRPHPRAVADGIEVQIIDVDALERFNSVWIVTGGKGVGSGIVAETVIKVGKPIVHALGFAPLEIGARPAVPGLFGIE